MLTFYRTVTTLLAATLLSVLDGLQLALPRSPSPVINGRAADAEWKAAKAASETDGPLLGSQSSTDLVPTAFSPKK